ncbi:MAG TPA: LptF/LptG family permease [Candidatus Megaira endosymbiont of Nemacystus decipiens]|nr:LptF/LptG family permease [Candidatus Megaera endosymbiont of Nemacystus decipiens]
MYIYNKYIIRSLIPILLLFTLIITSMVWIMQTINLSKLIDKGIALSAFFKLTVLLLPYFVFIIMPLVSTLAVIFLYHKLQDERQVVVLRGAGLSNFALSKPALYVAMLVTIILYYISLYLLPTSYSHLKSILSDFKENYVSSMVSAKKFNQLSKYSTLYVEKKVKNNAFEGVILFDNEKPDTRTIFFAEKGSIQEINQENLKFVFYSGMRHSYDKERNISKLHFDDITVNITRKNLNLKTRTKTPLELFIHEMIWPDDDLPQERQNKLIVDGHMRLIWPFYNFVFVLLSLSIFLKFPFKRQSQFKQYAFTFAPIIVAIYTHFTFQKFSYYNINYLFVCYINIAVYTILAIWQSISSKI